MARPTTGCGCRRRRRHRSPGFTLVELLVVIGIIALLISILLPSLARAQATARKAKCLNALRQLGMANQVYATEFRDFLIPCRWGYSPSNPPNPPNPPPPVPASGPAQSWNSGYFLIRYFGATTLSAGRYPAGVVCPEATHAFAYSNAGERFGYFITLAYGMNTEYLSQTTATATPNTARGFYGAPHYFTGWRRNQIVSPADKIQFIDAIGSVNSGGGAWPTGGTVPYSTRYFLPDGGEVYDPSTYPAKSNIVAYRHSRGANALFYDGHAEWRHGDALKVDPADPATTPNKRQWQPQVR